MENILTLNQSIFGTKSTERKISRRALKASVQELYVPVESEEITYDEGYEVDGGGCPTWFAKSAINTAIYVCGGAFAIKAAAKATKTCVDASGKYLAKKTIKDFMKKVGIKSTSAIMVDSVINIILEWIDPVEGLVNWWDGLDGNKDGWIGNKGWFR